MAEEKKQEEEKKKIAKPRYEEGKEKYKERKESADLSRSETLIRILSTDIPGEKNVLYGLTRIKGISYSMASAICYSLKIDKYRKITSLSPEEIKNITDFINNPQLPAFMFNRRRDLDTGEDKHIVTTNLDLHNEFDIRRLKKIRSYRGWRHAKGLPVRGQRTKAHFRHGASVGVTKTKLKPGSDAATEKGKSKEKEKEKK